MTSLSLAVVGARIRMPLLWVGLVLGIVGFVAGVGWLGVASAVLLLAGLAFYFRLGVVHGDPVTVCSPVSGRWLAMNSPANKVPSHGMQAYGQTYALDMAYEPDDQPRPGFGWRPLARRPSEFPGFGQPVFAVADGVVVHVHDRERDHWSRTSWPSMLLLLAEGVRELLGTGRILGNHVIIDCSDGVHAAFAHLRRGSVSVTKGQRVRAGEQIAACGNSGNTSEPHLHIQLMDHPNPLFAAGLPMAFERFEADGKVQAGLPGNGIHFQAEPGAVEVPLPGGTSHAE